MTAILSPCGAYRYRLEREVGPGSRVATFVMVNPSTADAIEDDQTIRKVKAFAALAGAGQVIVVNKFAFRATDVRELRSAVDPIGPDADAHIEQAMRDADLHIVAWGALAKLPLQLRTRWRAVQRIARHVGCPLHCLGTNLDGHPQDPLTLRHASRPLEIAMTNEPAEAINHPQHYGGADNPYEAIKVIRAWGAGFSLGNALKYMARAGKKDPAKTIEDLKKARWYLDEEIRHLEQRA